MEATGKEEVILVQHPGYTCCVREEHDISHFFTIVLLFMRTCHCYY